VLIDLVSWYIVSKSGINMTKCHVDGLCDDVVFVCLYFVSYHNSVFYIPHVCDILAFVSAMFAIVHTIEC